MLGRLQKAYEDMIRNTATEHAPWYVVPADNKWFTRLVVSSVMVETLESLDLAYPKVDEAKRKELEAAKKVLLSEEVSASECSIPCSGYAALEGPLSSTVVTRRASLDGQRVARPTLDYRWLCSLQRGSADYHRSIVHIFPEIN